MERPGAGSPECTYAIDTDDTLVYVDERWDASARAYGAPHLATGVIGTSLWSHITHRPIRQLYRTLLTRVRRDQHTARVAIRCDTPERRRLLELELAPAGAGAVTFRSRLAWEAARRRIALLDAAAARSEELITMCSSCQRIEAGGSWHDLDRAIERWRLFEREPVPEISHGLCPRCTETMLAAMESELFGP